jgi:hypothetical protein
MDATCIDAISRAPRTFRVPRARWFRYPFFRAGGVGAGEGQRLPPGTGETLVLVEQGAGELEVGETAAREHLMTTIGSDTSYAIRSVPSALMLALLTWSVSSGEPKPSPCRS